MGAVRKMTREREYLGAFVAFLFVFCALVLASVANASVSVRPVLKGFSTGPDGSYFRSAEATFNSGMMAYEAAGAVSVLGKPLSIPARIPLASTAGQIAKNAMRLNPWALAGTLALGYLADNLISPDGQGGYVINDNSGGTYPGGQLWRNNSAQGYTTGTAQGPYANQCGVTSGGCSIELAAKFVVLVNVAPYGYPGTVQRVACTEAGWCQFSVQRGPPYNDTHTDNYQLVGTGTPAPSTSRPMAPEDWDALPDPLPAVAPELPNAPYLPDGVPVDQPQYVDGRYPVGEPWKAADGTTKQTMANVTNNTTNNTVNIDVYNTTINNADGSPVPDPQPEDVPDPVDECVDHPDRLGCADLGTDNFLAPTATHNFSFAPEPDVFTGSCPAPIQVLGHTLSYQPACDAMGLIRPVVLGMAGLMAAFILFGAFRGGD